MKKLCLSVVLGFAVMLSSCAPQGMHMVDSKDDVSFASMYHAMKPAMLEKKLVDQSGNWYAPIFSSGPSDAGLRLVDQLCPKFMGDAWSEPAARVFRDLVSPQDRLSIGPYSATLRTTDHIVKLQLSAVSDWNNDGKDDWLVSCSITRNSVSSEAQEFFLFIADPEAAVLQAHVLMERQHRYGRVDVICDNSLVHILSPVTVEMEQGEADVTLAPTEGEPNFNSFNVKTSALSQ